MKWFLNRKIGSKLISGFMIVAIIGSIIGIVGVVSIGNIGKEVNELGVVRLPSIESLAIIRESQTAMKVVERTLLLKNLTKEDVADQKSRYVASLARIEEAWNRYAQIPQTPEEALKWNEFETQWETCVANSEEYMEQSDVYQSMPETDTEAIEEMANQMKEMTFVRNSKSFDKAESLLTAIIDINKQIGAESVINAGENMTASRLILIITMIIGMIISILLGLFLSGIISKPLKKMVVSANQIADGDLNVTIELDTKDEVGELAKAFRLMIENINEVMTNINSASEQVASGSRQVSDSSMSLSQGATEQASSIEELTASIEEIAAQTRQNAASAEKAEEMTTSAQKGAEKGNSQMADMLSAMTEINDSSNSISKIIKVIDDIAFQTNILALNAAVEAARAGQHGKGFAVVAEEVRNLAARSANAAKETTAMIEGSIQKVEGGTKIANETAKALKEIVEGISQATLLVGEIATASQEQALGVDQINQGITQISDVVQTTSATSEETAAASEELSGQAELLKTQVETFKLRNSAKRSVKGEAMDPEVLKMLESMQNKEQGSNDNRSTKKISLSDSDFEKY